MNEQAEFRPIQYNESLPDPEELAGKSVIVLDFAFGRDLLLRIKEKAEFLLVLDHHKTHQQSLEGLDFCTFDLSKSGARLTWEYIISEGELEEEEDVPWLVDYTEDRDLWNWKLPNSKEINAALRIRDFRFEEWERMADQGPEDFVREGAALIRSQSIYVRSKLKHVRYASIGGYVVPVVNTTSEASEVGHALLKNGAPFSASFFVIDDKTFGYSLRGVKGGVNVGDIAKRYGGGGHPSASGFQSSEIFPMFSKPGQVPVGVKAV